MPLRRRSPSLTTVRVALAQTDKLQRLVDRRHHSQRKHIDLEAQLRYPFASGCNIPTVPELQSHADVTTT